MLSEVPVIPVTEAVDWYQYDTADHRWLGDAERPVRSAGRSTPFLTWGVMLLHLYAEELVLFHRWACRGRNPVMRRGA